MLASKSTKSSLHRLTCRQNSRCTGLELLITGQNPRPSGLAQVGSIVTASSALLISDAGRPEVAERVGRADKFGLNFMEPERLM